MPETESTQAAADAPRCDCSLGWRFRKGAGPDPARCPVHGEPAHLTSTTTESQR